MALTVNGRSMTDGRTAPDPAHGGPVSDATFQELIGRVINDVSDLADKQVELAKQELNQTKDQVIASVKRLAIGAGIAAAVAVLLVIWAWTAFIWFFNWLGDKIWSPWGGSLGWILGLLLPIGLGYFVGYRMFLARGLGEAKAIWPPLPRTRGTLKEDLEWVQHLRTRSAR